jgi:hypothetical protein
MNQKARACSAHARSARARVVFRTHGREYSKVPGHFLLHIQISGGGSWFLGILFLSDLEEKSRKGGWDRDVLV